MGNDVISIFLIAIGLSADCFVVALGSGACSRDIRLFAVNETSPAIIIKLGNKLGNIKRFSNRIEVIKETPFLPAGRGVAEFATAGALMILVFSKIEPHYEGLALMSVIATIIVSVVLMVKDMDNPFEGSIAIDLRHIQKLDKYLDFEQDRPRDLEVQ